MTTPTFTLSRSKSKAILTEHPYIVREADIRSGEPIIRDTGMPVWLVAGLYKRGDSVEEISDAYPHVPLAGLHDALSYYYDHKKEIDRVIASQRKGKETLKAEGYVLDKRGFYVLKLTPKPRRAVKHSHAQAKRNGRKP